ncbi:MAG: M20 metallopeptidase family protein [Candidatus Hodarchaeales archaeon]|jgi:amidohydrolase
MVNQILDKSKALTEQIIKWRRYLHKHPELGFEEIETAKFIEKELASFGLKVRTGIGKTGIVVNIGSGKPCIALRADMDALPIQDTKKVPYASENPGVSHACGHDAHVAMLLGVAKILADLQNQFTGEIRLLFQPLEEGQDSSGLGGAKAMILDGALEGVDAILGQHVHGADLEAGFFQVKSGYLSAAVDTFQATIYGKGCHGAYPHNGIDPIFLTAQVINLVQGIISRRIDPIEPGVISFGKIQAGSAPNIIPDEVKLEGTIRSLNPDIRKQIKLDLENAFKSVESFGGSYQLDIMKGSPSTDFLPKEKILTGGLGMGAEDFSEFMEMIPGAYFYLGVGLKPPRMHHASDFDLDESVLYLGTSILAEAALRYLKNKKNENK